MSVLHLLAGILAMVVTVQYADRTIWLARYGTTQTRASLMSRVSTALLPFSLGVGFFARAAACDPFDWFHYFVVTALISSSLSLAAMRGTAPT